MGRFILGAAAVITIGMGIITSKLGVEIIHDTVKDKK